jgi:NNP family nitrate/nitrite transporter-like MFS transporter
VDGVERGGGEPAGWASSYSTNQLFWLAALPALCGATLRIFYSFMVPHLRRPALDRHLHRQRCCCRRWASALRCRTPDTPYEVMVLLALLCGLGGGNFASSHGQHQLLLPQGAEGLRAGHECRPGQPGREHGAVRGAAGHHGRGVRRAGRRTRMVTKAGATTPMWLQNAGFIWVPFIALSAWQPGLA